MEKLCYFTVGNFLPSFFLLRKNLILILSGTYLFQIETFVNIFMKHYLPFLPTRADYDHTNLRKVYSEIMKKTLF